MSSWQSRVNESGGSAGGARGEDAAGQEGAFQRAFAAGAAAAKARRLAHAVQAGDGLVRRIEHAAVQVGAQAAQALARDQLHLDGDVRPGTGLLQRRGFAGAQLVRRPTGARAGCGGSGRRCAACARSRSWRRRRRPWPAARPARTSCVPVSAFIFAARPASVSSTRKCLLSAAICFTSRWLPSSVSLRKRRELHVADALVVLGARDGELLGRDAPVQQVPGPGFFLRGHALAQPVGVEAGDQRLGADAPARVVQPQRRLAGDGGQAVPLEMRERVRKAGGVVPHLAGVGDAARPAHRPPSGACAPSA